MDLRLLLCAVLLVAFSAPALAALEHRRIRITGYETLNHLLALNNPYLDASLSNRDAYEESYRSKLRELEHLVVNTNEAQLVTAFTAMRDRIAAFETSGRADSERLASWINPILDAHTKLDLIVAAEERKEAEGNSPVSDIMLRLARISFYYELRTFSTLFVPLLRDAADPIATLDSEIISDFAEAQQHLPNCSKVLGRSLRDYRFIRPGLLDSRSAWIHDSVHRYTSSISFRLAPMLKDGSCASGEPVTVR